MIWTPRTTVAAVIEKQGRFLLVEEQSDGQRVVNQPAGHMEDGESLVQAAVREVLEETGQRFHPLGLVGIYRYRIPKGGDQGLTYLRYCFHGTAEPSADAPPIDADILGQLWLTPAQLRDGSHHPRSPMVLRCLEDYLDGQSYPLELLHDII